MRRSLLLAIALGAAACTGFDVGNPYRMHPVQTTGATDPAGDPDAALDDGSDDPDEAEGGGGPATIVPDETDGGAADAKPNAFTSAGAYAATAGPSTRKAGHDFAGATPTTNPAGRPCLQCHGSGGPAPRFAFAGTVYKDATGTPAPRVQVRVVGADGVARTAFTDADGNFFFRFASGAVKFPALAGARDGDTAELMTNTTANGNCNSCHRAGGTEPQLVVQ